jgi:hypothetical protein
MTTTTINNQRRWAWGSRSSGGAWDGGGSTWDSGSGMQDSGGGMWDSSLVTLPCNSSTAKYILISLMTTSVWLDLKPLEHHLVSYDQF